MLANRWVQLLLSAGVSSANLFQGRQYEANNFTANCAAIASRLEIPHATVDFSQVVVAGTNLSLPDRITTCGSPFQVVTTDLCRVALNVATSNSSETNLEVWLPSNWTGRFLSIGNGGLGGCIFYDDLAYAASLGFASVGVDNGHTGNAGDAFYNHPEVVADFAYRSIHIGAVVGKKTTKTFYGSKHTKSYYLGCSTGGRQGFKSAQDFPEDFDGIIAGAPAIAFNNLTSYSGHFYNITGPPNSETFVPASLWSVVHQDILKQCDLLDGYADGVLEDASLCNYNPSTLICGGSNTNSSACLTPIQAETVRKVFSPLTLSDGSLVYPRMQPGSEAVAAAVIYNGVPFPYTTDWFRYAIYNDPSWDPTKMNETDYINAARKNPFDIETWKGDLSRVRDRGAKIIHYHGQMDAIIPSTISPRYYEHVSKTMDLKPSELDDFYRLFKISGMAHCTGGDGAAAIGQRIGSIASLDPRENILTAVVEWVENGVPPETIVGTKWVNNNQSLGVDYKRAHCRYPRRNVYKGEGNPKEIASWECVEDN